jgi:hypothetical protein
MIGKNGLRGHGDEKALSGQVTAPTRHVTLGA